MAKKQNSNLHKAKREKNDEFYTRSFDIETELSNYQEHLKGKVVYCNCDDFFKSNFANYFSYNLKHRGIKKLITTSYEADGRGRAVEYTGTNNPQQIPQPEDLTITDLDGDGDFRGPECVEYLKEADIVITNPPFSLFREFIAQMVEYDKKFLIIGNMNAVSYKEIFPLIKDNKLWLGVNPVKKFLLPDNHSHKSVVVEKGVTYAVFGNTLWFTNMNHPKRNEELILFRKYEGNEEKYPKYDNYDAIEVSKVRDIPYDYNGIMGVPITFLDRYNPAQFEIIRFRKGDDGKDLCIQGKCPYFRILIKRRNNEDNIN